MAQTLNQLFEQPDFISGSYAKRQELFSNWKVNELTPYMQPLNRVDQRSMLREVEKYFNEVVPPPAEPGFFDFSDAGTALSAGTDQAQAIVGEVGIQGTLLERDQLVDASSYETPALQDLAADLYPKDQLLMAGSKAREVNLQDFVDANVQEGAEERKGFSDYVKDKQRELQEAQDSETTDAGKAAATMGFYLGGVENLDMLGLLALESAPASAAAMGVTAAGGLIGGVPGAVAAGAAVEGALGAGEASLGAYQTALSELKKQGVPEAEAKRRAREASRTAAAIGGAASAALGPLSEVLPVIRSFRKPIPKKTTTVDASGVGRTVTEIGGGPSMPRRIGGAAGTVAAGTAGEFLQGASVQVAENIAVDPITPTDTFEGALLAGTTEALAGGATTATMQGLGSAGRALTNERRLGSAAAADLNAELTSAIDTEFATVDIDTILVAEATDKATEIMSTVEAPVFEETNYGIETETPLGAADTTTIEQPDIPDDSGGIDSPSSDLPIAPAISPASDTGAAVAPLPATDTGSVSPAQSEVPVPEQPPSADTPNVTSTTQQASAAPADTGNGTIVPTVPETQPSSDGSSSTAGAGVNGATGESSGDSTAEVVEDEVITDLDDVPQFAEEAPPQLEITPQSEWDEFTNEGDIPYSQLSKEDKEIWDDQVQNFIEDPTFSLNDTADLILKRNKGWKPTTATAPIPVGTIDYMRNGTADEGTSKYIESNPLPLVVDGGTPQAAIITEVDPTAPLNLEGEAGLLNAAIKASPVKQTGTYIIADPATEQAHIMTKAGVLQATVPFASLPLNAPVHTVKGPDGSVPYQRVQVKDAKGTATRTGIEGVWQYEGMVAPNEAQAALRPAKAGFSGNVYVLQSDAPVEATTRPAPPSTRPVVNHFDSPLPIEIVRLIENNTDETNLMPVQEVIDAVLAHPETAETYPQYMRMLQVLSGHVDSYNIGHGNIDALGYHQGSENKLMLRTTDGMSYHTLTHEIAHAATVTSFNKRSVRTDPIWAQILEAYELLQGLDKVDAYGFTNPKEFVAELYTNPNFRSALDSIQGVVKNKTLWDHIRDLIAGDLLKLETEFDSDQLVDWVEALFMTNSQLQVDGMIPLGERGRTWQDKRQGRYSDDLQNVSTRAGIARSWFRKRMAIRRIFMDNTTPLLKWLNMETRLPTVTRDFDTHALWTKFNLAVNRKRDFVRKFSDNHFRKIDNASAKLAKQYAGNGKTAAEMYEMAADYATASHIPNATAVQRNALLAELEGAEAAEAELDAQLEAGAEIAEEYELQIRNAVKAARKTLDTFDLIQRGQLYDAQGNPTNLLALAKRNQFAVQGGMTAIEAELILKQYAQDLAGPNGDVAQATADLEAIRQLYIEANRDIWQTGIANGEISEEEADRHAASGLDKDYIPFTGVVQTDNGDTAYHQAFGSTGAMRAPISRRRKGRLDPPENAYASLQRNLDNMASRLSTRPFKEQLLADIESGLIPSTKGTARLLVGKQQFQPKSPDGIQPIYLRTEEGTYQMWIQSSDDTQSSTLMMALNGISGEFEASKALRAVGRTTRLYAKAFTFATATFAPINMLREGQESSLNITSRNLTWKDADGNEQTINRALLLGNISMGIADPMFFADTVKVLNARKLSNVPIESEDHLVTSALGKKWLEAEAAGAINVEIDSISAMYRDQSLSKGDMAALRKLAKYAGEMQVAAAKNGKLSKAELAALGRKVQATAMQGGAAFNTVLSYWNTLFDLRTKVAIYAALTKQGMPSDLAAARTLDLANYNKQGTAGAWFTAITPFYRSIVFGAGNLARTGGSRRGIAAMVSLTLLSYGIQSLLRLIAGEDDEDPDFVYNRYDAVPALAIRGNLPIVIPGDAGEQDVYAKIPVGYGGMRVAHVMATQLMRTGIESPLDRRDDGMLEVAKVMFEELAPLPSAGQSVLEVDAQDMMQYLALAFTPAMLQGSMQTAFNINSFGSPVDFAVDRDKPAYKQGYFRTPELWTSVAEFMDKATGAKLTPQQWRGHFNGMLPGPLAAIPGQLTQGDREAKGLPFNASDELGWTNVFGLSRLYGRTTPPEETTAYSLVNEFRKDRDDYAEHKDALAKRKMTKRGPSRAKRKITGEWHWDLDKLEKAGKLHYANKVTIVDAKGKPKETTMLDLVSDFQKALRKSKTAQNKMKKEIRLKENAARVAVGEREAYAVSQRAFNEQREFFDNEYLEQRELFRDFIVNMRELRVALDLK